MKCKINKKLIISFILFSFVFGMVFNVSGKTDLEQKRDQLKEQSDSLSKSINDTKSKIQQQQQRKEFLDTEIFKLQDEINSRRVQISQLDDEICDKLKEIKELEKDIERNRQLFRQGISLLFKYGGDVNVLGILLNCNNVSNLFSAYHMIKSLGRRQNRIVKKLNDSSHKITCEKEEVETRRLEVSDKKEELESEKEKLHELINESDKIIENLNSEQNKQVKQLDLNSDEIKSLDSEISEYYRKQEQERKLREEEQRKNNSSDVIPSSVVVCSSGQKYAWPTPGFTTITSKYNEQRGSTLHSAIDIGGCMIYGTPIVAAQDGTVITAVDGCRHYSLFCSCGGGYGNYVVIDHGDGRLTLYAHQCRVVVSCGDHVKKGQVIGYVGSTGYSTGSHLHFETMKYVDGVIKRYNPLSEY